MGLHNAPAGLLEYEQALGGKPESVAARKAAEEFFLERELFRRLSTRITIRAPTVLDWAGMHYW